jgi:hypothetical protein
MFPGRVVGSAVAALILGVFLVAAPAPADAQRRAAAGGLGAGGGGLSGGGRATGVDEKDDLKDFHHAMEVQATPEQTTEFLALLGSTEAAKARLSALREGIGKETDAAKVSSQRAFLDQALEKAQNGNKKFLDGFSPKQKSGLKELTKRLGKADSDLGQAKNQLDQILQAGNLSSPDLLSRSENLDRQLGEFYDQQVILGREMGIDSSSAQGPVYALAPLKTPIKISNEPITVGVSGSLAQVAADNGQHTYKLALTADLSDLQVNITRVMRAQLNRYENCGQRVDVRRATLIPAAPASTLSVQLHYERWTCIRALGSSSANELAEGDGSVEMRLTAGVEGNALQVKPEFVRTDAKGILGEALKSDSLGEDVRDAAMQSLLTAMRAGVDFKITLPPPAQSAARLEGVRFQDAGAGVLIAILEGQVQLSDEQSTLMTRQLKATLAAQGDPPQATN